MTEAVAVRMGPMDILKAYIDLTKPRIIGSLLVTTYATMLIAAGESPSASLIFFTMLGGALSSGSANAINMVYDKDIDAIMRRTRWRPLPSGRVTSTGALVFAIAIGLIAIAELAYFVNPMAALLALSGNLFYVFVYTMWLKRTTVQNIVIGGAAGAVPPLVGWAAVTGTVNWAAFILFMIIFLWTPPHFWALALYKNDDYKSANIPMMPVVHGTDVTVRQMLFYCAILLPVSLMLVLFHPMTVVYFLSALLLGGVFAFFAYRLAKLRTDRAAKQCFAYSIVYLSLIFGVMVFDQLVMADVLPPMVPERGVSGYAVDSSRELTVNLSGSAAEGLPLTVVPSNNRVTFSPNQQQTLSYRVTNLSQDVLQVMADHDIQPEAAGGFFKKIQCFCFKEQTLQPGQTLDMPLVFTFVDALPKDIETISVHYKFNRFAAEPKADAHAGHDH